LFSRRFPTHSVDSPIVEYLILFLSFFLLLFTSTTGGVVEGTEVRDWGHLVNPGESIWIYYLFIIYVLGLTFWNIYVKYIKSSKPDKSKIRLMILGMIIFVTSEVIFNLLLPVLGVDNLYYLGDYSIIFFLGFTAFAIIKHRLFDVRFAVIRAVTYALSLSVITGLYFLLAFAVSKFIFGETSDTFSRGPADIGLVVLLALSFQPIKRFFDRITNKLFFKDNYSSSDFFSRLNRVITLTTDLRSLLIGSANEIETTLKIEQVYFVVLKQNGRLITAGTNKHNHIPRKDVDAIDDYIVNRGSSSIVRPLLDKEKQQLHMSRLMQSYKTEIIVPLLLSDQRIGYLCLGDKKSSNFNSRDVVILESVADELTIAIQNALAVEEIRELNATLQQRITNATRELRTSNNMLRHLDKAKDEFVSMASHQLRTPLTSIKGYISMVIEGDAGKVSDMQKQLLNEAFISSERMVHLINDFLNVSRIQTGKFIIDRSPVDLSKIVEQEIDSLQSSAVARDLKYKYNKPKDFPILNVDEGKLRQVIMNFADNALYYSHENTVIEVDLVVEGKEIIYTVKDTGIGVPKAEQEHLFSKFFRATNAKVQRPDGTGVGLYLAKRIITGHGGKVVFKSVEGKGSTFGFRLPIE
jgi:signal transduction histidine kinase